MKSSGWLVIIFSLKHAGESVLGNIAMLYVFFWENFACLYCEPTTYDYYTCFYICFVQSWLQYFIVLHSRQGIWNIYWINTKIGIVS